MNSISIPSSLAARPRFLSRVASALRRLLLADPARSAARQAEDIAAGVVPPSRRYDRALVAAMQRQAMEGGAQ